MKRNQSAMAAACLVAVLALTGCAGNRSWMPWGDTRADGAAKHENSAQGYSSHTGSRVDSYQQEMYAPR